MALADYQANLDRMVDQLQHQTEVPHWVLAHSGAVRAVATEQLFSFGPRGRTVHWIFDLTGRSIASLLAMWAIGFVVVVKWWFLAALAKHAQAEGVLVGSGAGSEDELFTKFEAELIGQSIRVNHNDPGTFGRVIKPTLRRLLEHLWVACRSVYAGLRESGQTALARNFVLWMTLSAMRVGTYVFVRTWAEQMPPEVKRIVFIAADVQCFAAVDGRKLERNCAIEYWQHGLHNRCLLIPAVDRIVALDFPEGRRMHRLSGSPFEVIGDLGFPFEGARTATLLFASIYTSSGFDKKDHIELLRDLFDWAGRNALAVVIRPHPREDPTFWPKCFPLLRVDWSTVSFSDCLARWKPTLVASWYSTALLDALRIGVAPVLLTEGSEPFLCDMMLPLEEIALRWPADRTLIEKLAFDQEKCRRWIARKQGELFAGRAHAVVQ